MLTPARRATSFMVARRTFPESDNVVMIWRISPLWTSGVNARPDSCVPTAAEMRPNGATEHLESFASDRVRRFFDLDPELRGEPGRQGCHELISDRSIPLRNHSGHARTRPAASPVAV
ncbi:hypothetical protein [Saccharopolyspora gloriosae]|uniref:Uncharacterized protein n=1 Tax=Saccharopolyspora gloriosae TaxID=455344 RepID=A0A840NQQ0_9PSEU|nr:hypothetical protein [Saccharopolyspora gloriosae]MBB5071589.1 hypothetical protein [Saccharopolyspora gloriosae]